MNAVSDAIKISGGPAAVARELGVTVQAVCFWRDGLRTIPAEHCITLERLCQRRVRCEEMRPDVDWGYLRSTSNTTQEVIHG